ncbi:MAG: DNA repair protein RecO [Lawsonibacter sp.]|jgi:DNA repair protein RecO (recombination protein O)
MHTATKGLVLRDVDYKESDKILTILTQEQGKLTATARGCRRRNSQLTAGCQLLCWSEFVLYDYHGQWMVKEATSLRQFSGLRSDLEKLALGCYFAEVTQLLAVEGLPSPELLSLVLYCLHGLDQLKKPLVQIKAAFELKAMCLAGYEPLLDGCAVCGVDTPQQPSFHLREGVLHCAKCREEVGDGISMPLEGQALAGARHIVYGDPKRLFSFQGDPEALRQLGDVAEAYLHTQLERGFHTLDFYKQVSQPGSRV